MKKVVINSHISSQKARDVLLASMRMSPTFHKYEIIICIGGHYNNTEYIIEKHENITYLLCNHNSIDFTGLIAINDLYFNDNNIYIYIHDTCSVGPNFFSIVNDLDMPGGSMYLWIPSMNMGIYSSNLLRSASNFLESRRNNSEENCQKFKSEAIILEDHIFKKDPTSRMLESDQTMLIQSEPKDIYNTGVLRVVEYYKCLDLYKYKANWHVKDRYELRN